MTICVAIEESPLLGFLFQPEATVIELPAGACSKMRHRSCWNFETVRI
jgi:hypothetical protein